MVRALLLGGLVAGCSLDVPGFTCEQDDQCTAVGARCEASRACSAPDATCASGRRYSDLASPPLAARCVAPETPSWLRIAGGPGTERLSALSAVGEVVVAAGGFERDARGLDGTAVATVGESDMMAALVQTSDGTVTWTWTAGSVAQDTLAGAELLVGGDVVVYGRFAAPITIADQTFDANNAAALMVRLRQDGRVGWITASRGGGVGGFDAATASRAQQVVGFGSFNAPAGTPFDLGTPTISTMGSFDLFVTSHDGTGAARAARPFGSTSIPDIGGGIAASGQRFVLAAAVQGPVVGWEQTALDATGGDLDLLVASFDASVDTITPRASLLVGGPGRELPTAVTADRAGPERVTIAGQSNGPIRFGTCASCEVQHAPGTYAWVTRFEATDALTPSWVWTLGDSGVTRVLAVAHLADGTTVAAGDFDGVITLGARGAFTSAGVDGFLAVLDGRGAITRAIVLTGPGTESFSAVAVDSRDRVVGGGTFEDGARLGDLALRSAGGPDALVAAW
jgi:hypothetical protein